LTVITSLSRTVAFRAVHRLYRSDWSEAENRAAFGPLADAPGHPHDYHCVVTVTGPLAPLRGMVVDLTLLDRLLHDEVVARLDGTILNEVVPEVAEGAALATCETLAVHLFGRLAGRLPAGVTLQRVRVQEDPTLYADCTAG
jgi:6-pyruvoyltetrahydropterin/6-carboxytetrahydropterin synthase